MKDMESQIIKQNIKESAKHILCRLFGFHNYEIIETQDLTDVRNNIVGKVYLQRCVYCGKLKSFKLYTEDGHYER